MKAKFKSVKCKSGLTGWQGKLQDVYSNLDELLAYVSIYGIAKRLKFVDAYSLWLRNPTLRGSVIPSDLELVKK